MTQFVKNLFHGKASEETKESDKTGHIAQHHSEKTTVSVSNNASQAGGDSATCVKEDIARSRTSAAEPKLSNMTVKDISVKIEECNIDNCLKQLQSGFVLQQDIIRQLQRENESLKISNRNFEEDNKNLRSELNRLCAYPKEFRLDGHTSWRQQPTPLPRKPPKKVVTYYIRRKEAEAATFHGLHLEFVSKIQEKVKFLSFELKFDLWDERRTDKPVIVFCLNVSRLGTDVEHALSDISGSPSIILIILHHRAQHDCKLYASSETVLHTLNKDVQLIVDVVFWQSNGLYDCDVNAEAVSKFINYVSAFNT